MDHNARPPRAPRPTYPASQNSDPPSYPDNQPQRPPPQPYTAGRHTGGGQISFQSNERRDRSQPYRNIASPTNDPESGADMYRKKSLVRPDREKIEPGHRQWHYRNHAAELEQNNANLVHPSSAYFGEVFFV